MLETTISILAILCAASVSCLSALRWRAAKRFRAVVYLAFAIFAGLVALLNISALLATDGSFLRTATLAYVGFATAVLLPAARALGDLTYKAPHESEHEDATL